MKTSIPLERGLGSSSSIIVAGIELACRLSKLKLTRNEKLQLGCELEGHPDNVVPAILGGLVISSYHNKQLEYVKFPNQLNASFVAIVPNYKMSTAQMRKILPQTLAFKDAVAISAKANVMVAKLFENDLVAAGRLMQQDIFHEPHRTKLVREFKKVQQLANTCKAYATYLSGAGSTIMCLLPHQKVNTFTNMLTKIPNVVVYKLKVVK
jgi:homoserine kinase